MAVAHVQSNSMSTDATASASIVLAFAAPVAVGSNVAGVGSCDGSTNVSSITDDKGNSYTVVDNILDSSNGQRAFSFKRENIVNAPQTITVALGASVGYRALNMSEISGAGAMDKNTGQLQASPGTGANAVTSGSVTPATANQYIFGGSVSTGGINAIPYFSAGTGFTKRTESGDVGFQLNSCIEGQIQGAAAAIAATFTIASNASAVTFIMTFAEASAPGGGGGPTNHIRRRKFWMPGIGPWNPYMFQRRAGARTVFSLASYFLTASQGTYTLTGVAAGSIRNRVVVAAQGAYTLTGFAANLNKGRNLTAAQGTYTITGNAAGLVPVHTLTAAQGTYTLTGVAATLNKGKLLSAAQGTYTLTGFAAGSAQTRVLAAVSGVYALSGIAAGLIKAKVLAAAQGTYTLTGNAATLTKSALNILTAVTGVYVFGGKPANLIYSGAPVSQGGISFIQRRRRGR